MKPDYQPGPLVWLGVIAGTCLMLFLFQQILWLVVPFLLALIGYYLFFPLQQRLVLADYWQERAASRAQVETAILDHLYEELPDSFDENEVRLLSARVLGLLMRPGGEQHLH